MEYKVGMILKRTYDDVTIELVSWNEVTQRWTTKMKCLDGETTLVTRTIHGLKLFWVEVGNSKRVSHLPQWI